MRRNMWLSGCLLAAPAFIPGTLMAQTPVTVSYSYSGLPLPIYSNNADIITVAKVFVPQALRTSKVTVRVKIDYPDTSDLNVFLFSPEGTRTILLEHNCNIANVDTTFDDSAPSKWRDFCPVEAGRGPFQGNEPLSNANNDSSSFGTWYLAMENNQSDSRSGWFKEMTVNVTGTPQVTPKFRSDTVVNSANATVAGLIAPGEQVSIYGLSLGPVASVTAAAGAALPTTLGGSAVTIGGLAAPISYASNYKLDVVVPNALTTGADATIIVTSPGGTTPGVPVKVVGAAPALYTKEFGGQGQVRAVNQDGTQNGLVTVAQKGRFITIYASGLGAVTPAVAAGAVPPNSPLSVTTQPVTATIGGVQATVQYAGLAPGFPGLYQVNVFVPLDVPSGAQELLIYSQGQSSQKGATIVVQ